ncbi:RHS repeat-associated core domain-containing protein [Micromonospora sp. NPDC127501]|uniref:RHS repeat-associated core domain-containing protein n=1 Tax=Micromonospora sp. NPDC127501 TaxID=3154872 RepID=UPI0033309B54
MPEGTGPQHNATFTSFDLSDRVKLQVNAGSGNLLIQTTDLVLPGLKDNLALGTAFNSLLVGSDLDVGAHGRGWRSRGAPDLKLIKADDDSVTYVAADGVVGRFTLAGSGYDTPKEFKATLRRDGEGWKLTEHESGRDLYFTSAGLLDKVEDRNDNVTDYSYDASGQLTKVTSDRGSTGARTVTVSYSKGRITRLQQSIDSVNARQVQYSYNAAGNLTQILPSSGHAVKFTYDSSQRVAKVVTGQASEPGTETRIDYDGQHRVSAVSRVIQNESTDNPDGRLAITRWAYLSATETKVADANTDLTKRVSDVAHTTYTVNGDKRITKTVDPDGHERDREYTPYHDVATSTDAMGQTSSSTYGANSGQSLTQTASPTGAGASASYGNAATPTNPTGNFQPSSSTDSQQNSSTYTYNGAGNKTSSKDAEAADAKVDYNSDGTVKTATDPNNGTNSSNFGYDGDKQLTSIAPPTGNSLGKKTFTYDAFGRIRTASDGGGRTLTYEYDLDDRTTRVSFSDGTQAVDFEYDGSGNMTVRDDAQGSETFVYDRLNRLVQRGDEWLPMQYTYDPVGNLTKLYDASRGATEYTYDKRNLLTKMVVDDWTEYTFSYDDEGRRTDTKMIPANGPAVSAHTHVTYDNSGRITRTTTKRWERISGTDRESVVYDVSYCYAKRVGTSACSTAKVDDTGLRQWQTEHHRGGVVQVYTYDRSNRLTKATNLASGSYDYTYDSNGNRTSVKLNGTETQRLTFNSANQITSSGYSYDGAGNQTNGSVTPGATYNAAGQTTGKKNSAGQMVDYEYSGLDQVELRSFYQHDDDNTQGYYDWGRVNQQGQPSLERYQAENYDTHYFERDGRGDPVGVRVLSKKTYDWTDYFYVLDGLGSVVSIINENGSLAGHYTYDPYGRTTNVTANDPVVTYQPIGFGGGLRTGDWVKFGKRWYDPNTGRFTQQDSVNRIGDPASGNRYAYAADNPVNYVDSTGLSWESAVVGGAVGFIVGTAAWGLSGGNPIIAGAAGGAAAGFFSAMVSSYQEDGSVNWGEAAIEGAIGGGFGALGGWATSAKLAGMT